MDAFNFWVFSNNYKCSNQLAMVFEYFIVACTEQVLIDRKVFIDINGMMQVLRVKDSLLKKTAEASDSAH